MIRHVSVYRRGCLRPGNWTIQPAGQVAQVTRCASCTCLSQSLLGGYSAMIPQPLPQSRLWLRSPPSEPETAQSRSVQVFDAQQWNPCPCRINRSGALHVVLASLMSNSTSAGLATDTEFALVPSICKHGSVLAFSQLRARFVYRHLTPVDAGCNDHCPLGATVWPPPLPASGWGRHCSC